jgi:hypothetical protein
MSVSKELSQEKVAELIAEYKGGMAWRDLSRKYHITKTELKKYVEDIADTEEEESIKKVKGKKKEDKEEPMISDKRVEHDLFTKFEKEAAGELLPMLKEEFKARFKAGGILLHYDVLYPHDLEEIGVEWTEFLDFTLSSGYKMLMDKHVKQVFEEVQNCDTDGGKYR